MGLLAAIDQQIRASAEGNEHSGPLHDFWYNDTGESSDSGIQITEKGALRISTVWKCVDWWYRMYGTLPHKLFERTTMFGKSAQVEAVDHRLHELIHTAPSPGMSSAEWHGLIAADLKTRGNFYAAIVRDEFARILWLPRLRPDYVRPAVEDKKFWYFIKGDDGREVKFYPDEVLHIRGMGFDGMVGYSPVTMQMNLLGWNRATQRYGAQFFKNASRPSGLVELTNGIKPERRTEIIEALRASGRDAGKLVLIEGATKFHKMTLDQDEAQFLLTYQQQEEDIAGLFGVSPHEIGINRNINNSITEQQTINSVTRSLNPFTVSVEQQMDLQLLSTRSSSGVGGSTERKRYFFQSNLKGLLRGDTAAQTAHIIAMRDRGIYDGNDCAAYLGNPAFEGGDIRVINRAYGPLDMIDKWSMTSQNNPPAKPQDSDSASDTSDTKKALAMCFRATMRDAVGRTCSRKKDRELFAATAFRSVIEGIAGILNVAADGGFINGYLDALGKRSQDWKEAQAEAITDIEMERIINVLLTRTEQ